MCLSDTVMEIGHLKDMYTDTTMDKTTDLLISSNVHFVHTWRR